jgi:adenylate kinase family enzyme
MQRVAILGRGGAGKSVLARQLGERTHLPVIELDAVFWRPGPVPAPVAEWAAAHQELIAGPGWIIDGDLGPYDVALAARLAAADTVIVLDFGFARCAWRSLRRGREQGEYWRWVWFYRRRSLPGLLALADAQRPRARVGRLRSPAQVRRFLAGVRRAAD